MSEPTKPEPTKDEKPVAEPASVAVSAQSQERMTEYWRKNITLILILLGVWATVSYVCGILLVEPLNTVTIGQLPLGFWFAQQGSIYVFIIEVFTYCFLMDRLDKEYDVHE